MKLLPPDSTRVVYDIRRDAEGLHILQQGALSDGPGGVELKHGLIGSDEWWFAIESGTLKMETFTGVIRGVEGGMKGDTLNVHIDGPTEKQRWIAWRGFNSSINGKTVCTRFVRMLPKTPIISKPNFTIRVLIQVEVLD